MSLVNIQEPMATQFKSKVFEITDAHAFMDLAWEKRWTDGLPVLPPTEEKVGEMLDYMGVDPQKELGAVPPKGGIATYEKVAIQCVMGGCKPEYMPIVVAALEAMLEERFNLNGVQCTAHICAPLTIVSGPAVDTLGFNSSFGLFAGGSRANACVGRAVRLILWNIGGGYTGSPDRSSTGHPGRYTYCIAENQDGNPWEPLHVERGFHSEQTCVTVFAAEAPHFCQYGVTCPPVENLRVMAHTLATLGNNNIHTQGELMVLLSPGRAEGLAKEKWTKTDVKKYLFDHARLPMRIVRKSPYFAQSYSHGWWQKWIDISDDDTMVPLVDRYEDIHLVIGGGVGAGAVIPSWGKFGGFAVTKPVRFPEK